MKDFWTQQASKWPIVALAPMDGYCDSAYREINKRIAPDIIVFSEFYSADGLKHSKTLAEKVLPHTQTEKPLIIQIFGSDPQSFVEAGKIIQDYGVDGIDINMGCPAKKVIKCGYGSGLMMNTTNAFAIVEALSKAVDIPVSVKTRLGWETHEWLVDFCKGLENAGANMVTVHGRTYKQAFKGDADWNGIYELKNHLSIPVLGNGDVRDYDDGVKRMQNLDGFMIGRGSFGNPWCFLPWGYHPTFKEILDTMDTHAQLLINVKWEHRGCLEIRKHLSHYLHDFEGVREYKKQLVHVETYKDVKKILNEIRWVFANQLKMVPAKETIKKLPQ